MDTQLISNETLLKNRKSRKTRAMIVIAGSFLGIIGMVRATTADTTPATQPAAKGDLVMDGTDGNGHIKVSVNKSVVVTTKVQYKRVNVSQPEIADVNPIGPNTLLVTAKKAGSTQLIVWDDADRSQVIDVTVEFDLQALIDQYKTSFPGTEIKVSTLGGAIALRGHVPNLQTADQAAAMAQPYSQKVLNFLEISGGQQVCLQVRFAEVSRSASNQLGVNFGWSDGHSFAGNNVGQLSPLGGDATSLAVPSPSAAVTLFGKGLIGDSSFSYFIVALRQNNLLRILAEPNLIAMSGQEASFLAGGEYPVPVTQGGGTGAGGSAVTVEYREFGVKLKMTPLVLGDGRIRLKVSPEVSDLDFSTAVRFNGFVVPGLSSRKVETTIELSEGQTFAIAGLLNNNITSSKDVTPLLGDLPVIGALFRSVRYQHKETELVVLVTPKLIEAMNPGQVPALPGEKWRDPSEVELYLGTDLGGPENSKRVPTTQELDNHKSPRFQGKYGFSPTDAPAQANTSASVETDQEDSSASTQEPDAAPFH